MSEKSVLPTDAMGHKIQAPFISGETTQTVTISGSSAKATNAVTKTLIRLYSTTTCHVTAGATGDSATTSDFPLVGGVPEYVVVNSGDFIHAITSGTSGTLYVTEV